jgi:AcrR family transcriptional regulator
VATTPRKRPRQERAQETVETLLAATARILVEQGYDRASTNQIARTAGVSIGSLYQYFPSKEALVAALIDRQADMEIRVMSEKMLEVSTAPLQIAVRELVTAMLEAHRINPRLHKVLFEQVPRLGRLKRMLDLQKRAEELLCAAFEARRKELRPKNVALAVFILANSVEAITHAATLDRTEYLDDPRLVDEVTDLVLRYLAA